MSETGKKPIGAVMVVGGGVAAVQAALDLADSGFRVYLVEKSPAIGGHMAQLDKTFPTNDCSMCILAPKLVECGRHDNITLMTNSELIALEGEAGNFRARLKVKARYVDVEKCVACGICAEKCPTRVPDEFNRGLSQRKAIYIPYPQAVPLAYAIDPDNCRMIQKGKCGVCAKVCEQGAINYDDADKTVELDVGSVILAPGFEVADAARLGNYGYGRCKNVVTSIEFERMLSASGPSMGHISRPSDGKEPRRIAFLQCVGSRDDSIEKGYCSSVCCMYAIKETIVAKEHLPQLEPTIFFMDMRCFGKGFERYYERAKARGVRFIRSRIASVEEIPRTANLLVSFEDESGELRTEEFDMVVLSVGLWASAEARRLAEAANIQLNDFGFARSNDLSPVRTERDGVFVAGAFSAPKDIPETVMEASAAAAECASLLAPSRGSMVEHKQLPPERDVTGEPPRIGVFVCHCGINIGSVVRVPEVVEYSRKLRDVVYAEEMLYACSQDSQERIKQIIEEKNLNRVVVASCSPRTHEPLFRSTVRQAGLNEYLFEMANIRDQCSWVHSDNPDAATEKAKDLVRMAVAKARLIQPLERQESSVTRSALVIGGGVAGMSAALALARMGFESVIVERDGQLGGNARQIHYTINGEDVQRFLSRLIESVQSNPRIRILTNARIENIEGFVGNFKTTVHTDGGSERLEHGVIIVATGAREKSPEEYEYGKSPRILTQRELEQRLSEGDLGDVGDVVMIQCVGSRDDERPYCSRVCCQEAVKNALKLKQLRPDCHIYILYRDVRTYGLNEPYYTKAREAGVIFIRFDENDKPQVTVVEDGKLTVEVFEPIIRRRLLLRPDLLVLSMATVPDGENRALAKMLKVPLTEDGFFLEAHVKLRPVDFATDGIFVCGLAHAPKLIPEAISQALAAAGRASIVLSRDRVIGEGIVCFIDERICSGCRLCVGACPYEAISFDEAKNVAVVNRLLCKGCGTCAAICPSKACTVGNFRDEEIFAQIEALLRE